MKKFLTFVLVLAMVMSVSSFAMAAETKEVSTIEELNDAINAAGSGDVIKLTADIPLTSADVITPSVLTKPSYAKETFIFVPSDKNITLDLNGHTVSCIVGEPTEHSSLLWNMGTLVITDTSENKDGKLSYTSGVKNAYSKVRATITNVGSLTVNAGRIENLSPYGEVTDAIENNSHISKENKLDIDTKLVINGGELYSVGYYAVRSYTHYLTGNKNDIVVNGGSISGNGGIYMQAGDLWYYPDEANGRWANGTLTVNGGTIGLIEGATRTAAIRFFLANPDNPNFVMDVNDGTINGKIDVQVQKGYHYANGVSGATQKGDDYSSSEDWLEEKDGVITKATLSIQPDASLLSKDACAVTNTTTGVTIVGTADEVEKVMAEAPAGSSFTVIQAPEGLEVNGKPLTVGDTYDIPAPASKPSTGSGISVKYNGGNSFSTSKSDVPTGVEIDGVPVSFNGNGSSFTVSGIPAGAKWITVRWNSTSVTTNFTPNGAYFAEVEIPKTGDMSFWAAIAEFLGF